MNKKPDLREVIVANDAVARGPNGEGRVLLAESFGPPSDLVTDWPHSGHWLGGARCMAPLRSAPQPILTSVSLTNS
ncbi:hypothetical protein SAMN05444279_1219 [Ruegeria intermedia]|uniref:Uncharacterized protein n=1 Tax=Ruegeria intermedia TaxID=996115 RepID=A0A1M4ZPY1_9RHOB|nr:hypothetical protein [Ruegeria intermedia]SHF20093.1 hypothetical protein SAMN05444279_1219 [Ruegeria intermedia]